jgi:hypothetical protein
MSDVVIAAIIGAAFGVFATLAGGVLSWWSNWWTEVHRWKREDTRRFHDLRLDLYARYLQLAYDLEHGLADGAIDESLIAKKEQLGALHSRLVLLAPPTIISSASKIGLLLNESAGEVADTRAAAQMELGRELAAFVHLARRSLDQDPVHSTARGER